MNRICWSRSTLVAIAALFLMLESCQATPPLSSYPQPAAPSLSTPTVDGQAVAANSLDRQTLLQQSWAAYRQRFIQADGRVIDREANDRSISEGQAYAMLRAVMIGDRDTFDRTLAWAEANLKRTQAGKQTDSLWAWKWGKDAAGQWGILDPNFASDADVDAIHALIFASRKWKNPSYLALAKTKLKDLWELSTIASANGRSRYLLPGPAIAFQKQTVVQLNPSYFAPYAFRLFAQIDSSRNWGSLVESSYEVLQKSTRLSSVKLPNDWLLLDLKTGAVQPMVAANPGTSEYSFDAYRVWWRIALDDAWFKEPRARQYLQQTLAYPKQLWRSQQRIPARIDLKGQPNSTYEATSQYGMLYAAFRIMDPSIAQQIDQQKLQAKYSNGFWDNDTAYYTQNLVWLGLLPPSTAAPLLKP
jgi:endoglucanase